VQGPGLSGQFIFQRREGIERPACDAGRRRDVQGFVNEAAVAQAEALDGVEWRRDGGAGEQFDDFVG
jgi:hypothetical protein